MDQRQVLPGSSDKFQLYHLSFCTWALLLTREKSQLTIQPQLIELVGGRIVSMAVMAARQEVALPLVFPNMANYTLSVVL